PGGEKMFGWALSNGPNKLVTFHPAQQFAKQFHRPDVIRLAVELGSVEAALKKLATAPADIEAILPPSATLKLVKQEGAKVQVQATASSGQKEKPILTMRLLLDGRPLPQGQGKMTVPPGKPAEATWDVEIPGGSHELKLLASSDDDSATSDPLVLIGPKNASQQPTLHRVCVGVNDYDDPGIKLNAAVKDAQEVFAAFASHCVGSANRFGTAKGQLLVNKEATRDAVLKALAEVRKAAKPGDLVVFFFAGHGVKQENEFYLLTKEADLNKSLKGISLSGDDLRKALSDIECPVLLIMDACHSAKGVKAFRPATDDLTRNLTDETAGVTILAAAMAHEVANASAENGHFTAALLKALNVGEGVPFDPYERALFTHHIYSVIFSEVRKATNGKQNPFLNSPWTVPPLAVREIPKQ
ncbi:MAG: caspase family protein, partial [Planctomycetes bacterium]|nr:caspase family protein [Planctomycetota bacterium]